MRMTYVEYMSPKSVVDGDMDRYILKYRNYLDAFVRQLTGQRGLLAAKNTYSRGSNHEVILA